MRVRQHSYIFRNVKLKRELTDLLGYRESDHCPASETERRKWCRILSEKEWTLSEQLLELLKFCRAPMLAFQSNDSPTLSVVGPFVIAVIKNCRRVRDSDTTLPPASKVASSIIRGIKARFAPVLDQAMYSVATLVDPFAKSWFTHLPTHVQKDIRSFIVSKLDLPPVPNRIQNQSPHMASLGQMLPCTLSVPTSQFDFDAYVATVPQSSAEFLAKQPAIIRELYISVCGIPAASSEIERLFSTCGNVNSKLRCSLKPENVERQSLLRKNAEKIKIFSKTEGTYPQSTSKLQNWISELPKLSKPFFDGDEDDGIEIGEEGRDYVDEGVEDEESVEEEEELITDLQGDGYWSASRRPKNFHKEVAELKGRKRKRQQKDGDSEEGGGEENDSNNVPTKKHKKNPRYVKLQKAPIIGNFVYIHFSDDCKCKIDDPFLCTCDLWYRGKVTSECDKNANGDRVFAVLFVDHSEEEIEWKVNGNNNFWATCNK